MLATDLWAPPPPRPRQNLAPHAVLQDKKRKRVESGEERAAGSDCEVFPSMGRGRQLELAQCLVPIHHEHASFHIQIPNFFASETIPEFLEQTRSWLLPRDKLCAPIPKAFKLSHTPGLLTPTETAMVEAHQLQLQQQHLTEQRDQELRIKIRERWVKVGRIEMPRFRRMLSDARSNHTSNARKLAGMCQKEIRKRLQKNTKSWREVPMRAKRLAREVLVYWRRHDKEQTETKMRAEKEEVTAGAGAGARARRFQTS